eukprot:TRINITY_DN719_c0_g1_i4.p1 TRINITY_DN719_c0_g1~~TRINITY_DN719_c0_g1_i4.p1  ORF type:complete len:360 (+),score=101.49 TRINITY_DN719_c0_g1_i4:1498-2577(+)
MAMKILQNTYKELQKDPVEGFCVEFDDSDILTWKIYVEGPPGTPFEGGIFQMEMKFPPEFPMQPPALKFVHEFWHPNVYPDGRVCISILHPPGEDMMSGERPEERWLPVHSVQTIVLSVLSILGDPNYSSPANVDASVQCQKRHSEYLSTVKRIVQRSLQLVPSHIKIPHPESNADERKKALERRKLLNTVVDDDDFDDSGYGNVDIEAYDIDYGDYYDDDGSDVQSDVEEESSHSSEKKKSKSKTLRSSSKTSKKDDKSTKEKDKSKEKNKDKKDKTKDKDKKEEKESEKKKDEKDKSKDKDKKEKKEEKSKDKDKKEEKEKKDKKSSKESSKSKTESLSSPSSSDKKSKDKSSKKKN